MGSQRQRALENATVFGMQRVTGVSWFQAQKRNSMKKRVCDKYCSGAKRNEEEKRKRGSTRNNISKL